MALIDSFDWFNSETKQQFLQEGYVVSECENVDGLILWREQILRWFFNELCRKDYEIERSDPAKILNRIHEYIKPDQINDVRMSIYSKLTSASWSRPTFFSFAKFMLEEIVGNELAMQNRVNVNIMMPEDKGSNIPLHVDAHSGESPFQCVLWVPLTDVFQSKGMFLLPLKKNRIAVNHFKEWVIQGGREKVFEEIQDDLVWPNVPFGSFLLFSPTLIHGSVPNQSSETRWSFNARFKSLFSPYASEEKSLGTFYLPTSLMPATRLGLEYRPPQGLGK